MSENRDKLLEDIAMMKSPAINARGGLDIRHNDEDDFVEVSVWSIKGMLKMAYLLGKIHGLLDNKEKEETN